MPSIYELQYRINKGVNSQIEFRGLKAQYIYYLAIGLAAILIIFCVLYILGISVYLDLALTFLLGAVLFIAVNRLSRRFGAYGLKKRKDRKKMPVAIRPVRPGGATARVFRDLSVK